MLKKSVFLLFFKLLKGVIMKKILLFTLLLSSLVSSAAPLVVKDGDNIGFLGDSLTQFANREYGFILLVMGALKADGVKNLKYIPGGIGGDRSNSILARLDKFLARKPSIVILQVGVNDVAWGKRGVELPQYEKNIREIVARCEKAGSRMVLVTPTLHTEDLKFANNVKLAKYADVVRKIAREKNILLADWQKKMREIIRAGKIPADKGYALTIDKVHLNGYGNMYLSCAILETLGMEKSKVESFIPEWKKIPSMAPILNMWNSPQYRISMEDHAVLYKEAQKHKMTVDAYCRFLIGEKIKSLK